MRLLLEENMKEVLKYVYTTTPHSTHPRTPTPTPPI